MRSNPTAARSGSENVSVESVADVSDAPRSRKSDFRKGLLRSLPLPIALAVFAASMDSISQWAARNDHAWADYQGLLVILTWSGVAALVALLGATAYFWKRSRWVSYGVLSSIGLVVLAGVGLLLMLVAGLPGHD